MWRDFEEMEKSISMPELTAILSAKREREHSDRKFQAALQGHDLDGEGGSEDPQKEWEDMKARVFSGGKSKDSNDITSLNGPTAAKAGIGIGKGLSYDKAGDEGSFTI